MIKTYKFYTALALLCVSCTAAAATLNLQYHITGIPKAPLKNVYDRLKANQKNLGLPLTVEKIKKLYRQAPNNISRALEPYGYFSPRIQGRLHLLNQEQEWSAQFQVKPGPRTKIIALHMQLTGPGKHNAHLQGFVNTIPRELGIYLNTVKYNQIKQRLFDIAENQGYLKASFSKHVIKVNRRDHTARITLVFNTGPRYYFGYTYFSKVPLSLNLLSRYLPFKLGEPYSSQKLIKLQNNLTSSVYFHQVNIEPQVAKAKNHYIPVVVQLVPKKHHQYSFGLGFGTDTGVRGSIGTLWRFINPAGHYFQSLLQLSQQGNNSFEARYIIPGKNPVTDHYQISAGIFTDKPGNTNDDRYQTYQVGVSHVTMRRGWQRTLSLQFEHEKFKTQRTKNTQFIKTSTNTILPSVAWTRINARDRINTRNGHRLYFNLGLGIVNKSKASFLQGEFQGKWIRSFHQQNNRLIFRTVLGATLVKNFNLMPLSKRFFAGGAKSIRGYGYQQLGPGRYLVIGSIEFQHRLWRKLYGTVFYDAGNAFNNFADGLKQGVGVGLMYRSPVGPIEISVAHPMNQPFGVNRKSLNIQFSMGPDL